MIFKNQTPDIYFEKKLQKSINKYKISMQRIKNKRPRIIFLPNFTKALSTCKNTNTSRIITNTIAHNKCSLLKKNGQPCPAVLKKNSIYCHRHHNLMKST